MKNQINTWYVVSDIHGFYKELITGLKKAGYNKKDPTKGLIILGDIFDRGQDVLKVYRYLKSIPKSRRILIKGNHEELYFNLLNKNFPQEHDFHNHTVNTFCQIAGCSIVSEYDDEIITMEQYLESGYHVSYGMIENIEHTEYIDPEAQACWNQIKETVKNHEITKFLASDEWKDYYELDKYIFVHSFIPVNNDDGLPSYYTRNRKFSYKADWRTNATTREWSDARWGCPWRQYKDGLFKVEEDNGKVLVCGHWHTSDFYLNLDNNNEYSYYSSCTPIYYGKNIIAIDGGVKYDYYHNVYVHSQNVLIIDKKL